MKNRKLLGIAGVLMFAATCQSSGVFAKGDQKFDAQNPCDLQPIVPVKGDESHVVTIKVLSVPTGYAVDEDVPILFVNSASLPYTPPSDVIQKIKVDTSSTKTTIKFRDFNPKLKNYSYMLNFKDAEGLYLQCAIGPLHIQTSPAGISNPGQ